MRKTLILVYGLACYLMFLLVFGYFVFFLVDIPAGPYGSAQGSFGAVVDFLQKLPLTGALSKTVTYGTSPAGPNGYGAIAWDISLMGLFGIQHSVMARDPFKRSLARLCPAFLERSTYVLASSAVLALMMWQWQPIEGVLWQLESSFARYLLWTLFGLGFALTVAATFLTNHFDLFGLRHVYLHLAQKTYTDVPFKTLWLYQIIRHPMMLGLLISLWATPTMTLAHLLLACGMSIYVFIGVHFEERALLRALGDDYAHWRDKTPMLVPLTLPLRPRSRD